MKETEKKQRKNLDPRKARKAKSPSQRVKKKISEAGAQKVAITQIADDQSASSRDNGRVRTRKLSAAEGLKAMPGAEQKPMPAVIHPMLATIVANSFDNPNWLFEIKWDGYRAIAFIEDGRVR